LVRCLRRLDIVVVMEQVPGVRYLALINRDAIGLPPEVLLGLPAGLSAVPWLPPDQLHHLFCRRCSSSTKRQLASSLSKEVEYQSRRRQLMRQSAVERAVSR